MLGMAKAAGRHANAGSQPVYGVMKDRESGGCALAGFDSPVPMAGTAATCGVTLTPLATVL